MKKLNWWLIFWIITIIVIVLLWVIFAPWLQGWLNSIVENIVRMVWDQGYLGIFIMMVLESSFFPFPSEVAMIPAGYLISTWEMTFIESFAAWTIWALVGSSINYFLGYFLWEKTIKYLITKYWKYLFVNLEHYEKAEKYFKKHGSITTFVGRLITIIRQYISLPAWVFKMNFGKFLIYTGLWAWLWNIILISIGYIAWENMELMGKYAKEATIWVLLFAIIIVVSYVLIQKRKNDKN
jgi:membrane protein DedA with SNARE-associated domain